MGKMAPDLGPHLLQKSLQLMVFSRDGHGNILSPVLFYNSVTLYPPTKRLSLSSSCESGQSWDCLNQWSVGELPWDSEDRSQEASPSVCWNTLALFRLCCA